MREVTESVQGVRFVDFDERSALRRVLRRAFLAIADADRERAELDRGADWRLEFRDARGDLVEPLKQRHRLLGHIRSRRPG